MYDLPSAFSKVKREGKPVGAGSLSLCSAQLVARTSDVRGDAIGQHVVRCSSRRASVTIRHRPAAESGRM